MRRGPFWGIVLIGLLTVLSGARALTRGADGYYRTGEAVRIKKVAFAKVKVYLIAHEMKELPSTPSKEAVIQAEVEKQFIWTMLRSVDAKRIREALREAYAMNGYTDEKNIAPFVDALGDLPKGSTVTIHYDPATRRTSLTTSLGQRAVVSGSDFMRATWSIWLGKIDQPELSDALIASLRTAG